MDLDQKRGFGFDGRSGLGALASSPCSPPDSVPGQSRGTASARSSPRVAARSEGEDDKPASGKEEDKAPEGKPDAAARPGPSPRLQGDTGSVGISSTCVNS